MAVDVVSEIVIHRPRDVVAAFSADPTNAPRWYANIRSVEWVSDPPLRLGSRISFVARFLGRRLAYTYEIAALDLPDRLVMRTTQGPFPMETTYAWESLESDKTRMTLRNRGEPAGFPALIAPFLAGAMLAANRKDLRLLKSLLENPV